MKTLVNAFFLIIVALAVIGLAIYTAEQRADAQETPVDAERVQAAPSTPESTATVTPLPTVNPDIIARDAAERGAAESEATAKALQVEIIKAQATDDEARRRDLHSMAVQYTAEAVATERARDAERETSQREMAQKMAIITEQVAKDHAEFEKYSPIVVMIVIFILTVLGAPTVVYIILSGARRPESQQIEDDEPATQSMIPTSDHSGIYANIEETGVDPSFIAKTCRLAARDGFFRTAHWKGESERTKHEIIREWFIEHGLVNHIQGKYWKLTTEGVMAARWIAGTNQPPSPSVELAENDENTAENANTHTESDE